MTDVLTRGKTTIFFHFLVSVLLLVVAQWTVCMQNASAEESRHHRNSSRLTISSAYWDAEGHRLTAMGTAPARTKVTVENTGSGTLIGSTYSDRRGRWSFRQELSTPPCSIRATAGRYSATQTVSNASSECDNSQSPPVTLTGISIAGPTSINENTSASYTCTAAYSDNSTRNVTTNTTWSENSGAASISGNVLTAESVSSDQTVVITASFSGISATYTVTIRNIASSPTLSGLTINGPSSVNQQSTASYSTTASFSDGSSTTVNPQWNVNGSLASISTDGVLTTGAVTGSQSVIITAGYSAGGTTLNASKSVNIIGAATSDKSVSINSTSVNSDTLPSGPVAEQPFINLAGYKVFGANDLGMHCGDLDHRVASILPPYNVLHAQVVRQGTSSSDPPEILTPSEVEVYYSAASNPDDPALQNPPTVPVFKTNFWSLNPTASGNSLAFDGYDPFYPPDTLNLFPLDADIGLPAPDLALLYPVAGTGQLVADQQNMPGADAPYSDNTPQVINRFDTDLPFFVNFPFGYELTEMNWFAADGIPMTPYDDFGRKNSFPLVRVQAKTTSTNLTGRTGDILASTDVVIPISAEADCFRCHASSVDGGGAKAACIPGQDADCSIEGSPRSGTAFTVARAADDTADVPYNVKREWAADNNIIRLHDARHGTNLQGNTPVVCQSCHYSPALDLAHVGPLGPGDPNANGREQTIHQSNSRVMHSFHAQFTDLFANDMPAPTDPRRLDSATGKPVVNSFVKDKLNQSCYQCHPGRETQCLRGAMFSGGLICQDCHGGMQQVGDDFSKNFSKTTPYPAGADLTKRVPWANMPACQSCHTGDAVNNLGISDPNVIRSKDNIRLLRAYRNNDAASAKPIVATNRRFAENEVDGKEVLYRYSKGHSGIFCEACHGSTHAEWPVQPESGSSVANDNMAAIQLQGHTGKIIECNTCHTGSLPNTLGGPHGLHPVGNTSFANGGHENLAQSSRDACRACHGTNGGGTVLSKAAQDRTLSAGGRQVHLTKGQMVSCNLCHGNPL